MLFVKILQSLLIMFLVLGNNPVQSDDDDDALLKSPKGVLSVTLDSQTQTQTGLKTVKVASVNRQTEFETFGKVVSIEPLLVLRERYLLAQAELKSATAKLKQTEQNWQRQQALFKNGISAKRSLQELDAQKFADQAAVESSHVRSLALLNEAKLSWGDTLAQWIISPQCDNLKAILTGQRQLVQVTLPPNKLLPDHLQQISVDSAGIRSRAVPAEFIARSAQVDSVAQGENYFFETSNSAMRPGMKINAWIAESESTQPGVFIPESALLWYMDQAYIFIKTAENTFVRRNVSQFVRDKQGYFVSDGLQAGEEIVSEGAQLLLSEELRGQIPDDD
jgi:hypothetical protein